MNLRNKYFLDDTIKRKTVNVLKVKREEVIPRIRTRPAARPIPAAAAGCSFAFINSSAKKRKKKVNQIYD